MKICLVKVCDNKARTRGWCVKHYKRWLRHGDPLAGSSARYKTPEEAFAANTEWHGECLIWGGSDNGSGYGRITVGGKLEYAHRYAWERVNGPIPEGLFLDHKEHCNTLCCNAEHLRLATRSENNSNKSGVSTRNTSGHRNVHWNSAASKWQVTVKGQYYGLYNEIEEAAKVAELARKELFGEFAGKG